MSKVNVFDLSYEDDTLIVRVQHAPNEKIVDSLTIVQFNESLLPQRIKLRTRDIVALKRILDKYEYKNSFLWVKD